MLISEENLYNDAAAGVEDTIALPLNKVLNKFLTTSEKRFENCLMCCFNNINNKQTNVNWLMGG